MKRSNFDSEAAKGRKRHREVETTQAREENILERCKRRIYVLLKLYKKLYRLLDWVFKPRKGSWEPPSEDTGLLYLRLCRAIEDKLKILEQDFEYVAEVERLCLAANYESTTLPARNIFLKMRKMKWVPFERLINVGPRDWKRNGISICSTFLRTIEILRYSSWIDRRKTCPILDTDDLELLEMVRKTINQYKQVSKERKSLLKDEKKSGIRRTGVVLKFSTPPNTTWKMVKIKFVSEDSVRVSVKSVHGRYTFAEMGFKDNRKYNSPNTQWEVLRWLAKINREFSWQEETAIYGRKRFSRLRERLRAFFGIEDDPFFPYGTSGCYRMPKFKIENESCDE